MYRGENNRTRSPLLGLQIRGLINTVIHYSLFSSHLHHEEIEFLAIEWLRIGLKCNISASRKRQGLGPVGLDDGALWVT